MPLVSVVIPCYNRKDMLKECIESFLMQSFQDFEIVVVDDGSEEDLSFVTDMDYRVRYFRQNHLGISRAFNLALDNSQGKYVMPFGSDDLAMPLLLEKTLKLMEEFKDGYDVIYTNYLILDKAGEYHRKLCSKTLSWEQSYKEMLIRQYIPHGGTLWKISEMPRHDESLESAVDWELLLTALESGVKFKHLKHKLWVHRTGHAREFGSQRQIDGCKKVLARRGYEFDVKNRIGVKVCN